eukprot:3870236-Pyramimonas_sp.AAC.2
MGAEAHGRLFQRVLRVAYLTNPCTRTPAHPHARAPSCLHSRTSAYPHVCIPAHPHARTSAYPHTRTPAYPHARTSAYPHTRTHTVCSRLADPSLCRRRGARRPPRNGRLTCTATRSPLAALPRTSPLWGCCGWCTTRPPRTRSSSSPLSRRCPSSPIGSSSTGYR